MGYKFKSYIGVSKKATPRFESLGGKTWLDGCYDRYKEGETLQSISKDFDVPHTYIFERFLDFRLDTKRLSRKIPESSIPEILEMWECGYTAAEIAKSLNLDYKPLLALLSNKLGKDTSLGNTRKAVFGVNEDAFSRASEQRSYFYGLLLTDGCMWENGTVEIRLKTDDRHILEELKDFLSLKNDVKDYSRFDRRTNKTYLSSRVYFKSNRISEDLKSLGMYPRKSMKESAPTSMLHDRHFWRGVIDGDGHVGLPKNLPMVGLCGSLELCNQFISFCESVVDIKVRPKVTKYPENDLHYVSLSGAKALKVMSTLYDDSEVRLDRKYDRYISQVVKKNTIKVEA